jgi:hypothetical protein
MCCIVVVMTNSTAQLPEGATFWATMQFHIEDDAHRARRSAINNGHAVSLVALNPATGLYTFDVSDGYAAEEAAPTARTFARDLAVGDRIVVNGSEVVTVREVTRRDSANVANGVVRFTATNGNRYGLDALADLVLA